MHLAERNVIQRETKENTAPYVCGVLVVRAPVKEDENGVQTGGEVSLDLTGRKPGRGAYVCRDPECLKKAQKARRFERAFSCKIEDAVYDAMYQELCTDVKGKAGEAQK